jgi:hypothetical protein
MLCYVPETFCADYVRLVSALTQLSTVPGNDPGLREHLGYAIEQTLMRRQNAIESARFFELDSVEKRIEEADKDLLRVADYALEAFGVQVERFIP